MSQIGANTSADDDAMCKTIFLNKAHPRNSNKAYVIDRLVMHIANSMCNYILRW